MEHIVVRHGVPEQLLSDRGSNFLSELIKEVCTLLGMEKINTSGYHPQTDGLVERLIGPLSRCCRSVLRSMAGTGMPTYLTYCLLIGCQSKESPFFLLYGRDPRLPTEAALSHPTTPYQVDLADYRSELIAHLSDAWKLAHQNIGVAQKKQKIQHDKNSKDVKLNIGDRVMVLMKGVIKGKAWKFACPFHGPYRIVALTTNNAEVRLVDEPTADSIFVSLDRVRRCYPELPDKSWTGRSKRKRRIATKSNRSPSDSAAVPYTGPVTRARAKSTGTG